MTRDYRMWALADGLLIVAGLMDRVYASTSGIVFMVGGGGPCVGQLIFR